MASTSGGSEADVPDWSLLHEGSCLGRGLRGADGRWVFTGEGYDASHNLAPAAARPEGEGGKPHHRALTLTLTLTLTLALALALTRTLTRCASGSSWVTPSSRRASPG